MLSKLGRKSMAKTSPSTLPCSPYICPEKHEDDGVGVGLLAKPSLAKRMAFGDLTRIDTEITTSIDVLGSVDVDHHDHTSIATRSADSSTASSANTQLILNLASQQTQMMDDIRELEKHLSTDKFSYLVRQKILELESAVQRLSSDALSQLERMLESHRARHGDTLSVINKRIADAISRLDLTIESHRVKCDGTLTAISKQADEIVTTTSTKMKVDCAGIHNEYKISLIKLLSDEIKRVEQGVLASIDSAKLATTSSIRQMVSTETKSIETVIIQLRKDFTEGTQLESRLKVILEQATEKVAEITTLRKERLFGPHDTSIVTLNLNGEFIKICRCFLLKIPLLRDAYTDDTEIITIMRNASVFRQIKTIIESDGFMTQSLYNSTILRNELRHYRVAIKRQKIGGYFVVGLEQLRESMTPIVIVNVDTGSVNRITSYEELVRADMSRCRVLTQYNPTISVKEYKYYYNTITGMWHKSEYEPLIWNCTTRASFINKTGMVVSSTCVVVETIILDKFNLPLNYVKIES